MSELSEKTKAFITNNIPELVIFISCAVYCLYGCFNIEQTGKTLMQVLSESLFGMVFGIMITNLLGLSGINKGNHSAKVVTTAILHAKEVDLITPYIDEVDEWCDEHHNKPKLKKLRARVLSHYGIKYEGVFDEDGVYKPLDLKSELERCKDKKERAEKRKEIKHKKKGCKKALKVKLTLLSLDSLTNAVTRAEDPNYLGKSKKAFLKFSMMTSIPLAVGFGIFFQMYRPGEGFDFQKMYWSLLQVVSYLAAGAFKWFTSYSFVIDECRQKTLKQINYLQEFRAFKHIPDQSINTVQEVQINGNE